MIGTVYKIEIGENIYIGSTIKKLSYRQSRHNCRLNKNVKTNKLYEECKKHNIEKIICILLEEIEIEDIDEIRKLEQEYITKLQPSLNHKSAYTGLTQQQYRKEYYKEWRDNNKEKVKECKKGYYENNKKKLLEKLGEKIMCPICNTILNISSLLRHQKTKKCLSYNRHTASIK